MQLASAVVFSSSKGASCGMLWPRALDLENNTRVWGLSSGLGSAILEFLIYVYNVCSTHGEFLTICDVKPTARSASAAHCPSHKGFADNRQHCMLREYTHVLCASYTLGVSVPFELFGFFLWIVDKQDFV